MVIAKVELSSEEIRSQRKMLMFAIRMEERRHEAVMKEHRQMQADIQEMCGHPPSELVRRYDASGGSDSYDECHVCGAEI